MVPAMIRGARPVNGVAMTGRPLVRVGIVLAGLGLAALSALPLSAQAPAETVAPAAPPVAADPQPAPAPVDAATTEADLAAIESSIGLSRERADALKAEIAAMEG